MRHLVDRRKLGLPSDQRRALLTNLQRQFVRHGYVQTTVGRAKELQREVEGLINLTKHEDALEGRRRARKVLVGHSKSSIKPKKMLAGKSDMEKTAILQEKSLINGEDLVKHLFDHIGPRVQKRVGGFTRLTKIGFRRGDGAPVAVLELVD